MAKSKIATVKEVELNRWCIEAAMRWPMIHVPASYGNQAQGGLGQLYNQTLPARDVEADLIARAAKIRAWIKAAA